MNKGVFTMKMMKEKLERLRVAEGPRRARNGLAAAGEMLMHDAVMGDPAMPVDTTSLVGSGTVFVDGVKTAESPYGVPGTQTRYPEYGPRVYTDYRASAAEPPLDSATWTYEAQIAFNAPYAALRGGKQLSAKIGLFMEKYMKAIVDKVYMGEPGETDPNTGR